MRPYPQTVLLVALLALGAAAADDAAKKDLKELQGEWVIVFPPEFEELSKLDDGRLCLEVKDENLRLFYRFSAKDAEVSTGTIKIDPTQKPKAVDLVVIDPEKKQPTRVMGIYELGEGYVRCVLADGGKRPAALAERPIADQVQFVLKRDTKEEQQGERLLRAARTEGRERARMRYQEIIKNCPKTWAAKHAGDLLAALEKAAEDAAVMLEQARKLIKDGALKEANVVCNALGSV